MRILVVIILSLLSAALYRAGGIGRPFRSWMRDWLCPFCALGVIWILKGFHIGYWWQYLCAYGLMGGSLSTYWTPKAQEDVKAFNWALTGFFYGLASFPLLWAGVSMWGVVGRILGLVLGIMMVSELFSDVNWEEGSRGFLFTLSMLFLLV